MATIDLDGSEERNRSVPITRHAAFPAIVALWFAALLGLGSLLLPVILFERLAEMSGLAAVLPAAAPPLGLTARVLIAAFCGAFGAVLGLAVARRVSGAQAERRLSRLDPERVEPEPEKDAGDGWAEPRGRRRALAIADVEPFVEDIAVEADDQAEPHPESTFADYEVIEPAPLAESSVGITPLIDWRAGDYSDEDCEMTDMHDARPDSRFEEWAEPEEAFVDPEAPESGAAPEPEGESGHEIAPAAWESAPLEDFGLVQLVQRLASTIEKRREWLASARLESALPPQPAAPFDVAPAEEAAEATAAYFGSLRPADAASPPADEPPALLRPAFLDWFEHGDDIDEHESLLPTLSIPLRDKAAPLAPSFEPEDEAAELDGESAIEDEDVYGSLIGMKNPFSAPRSDFIRIEEPEPELDDVPEPAEEAEALEERPDTVDADAALRAALASLQKVSGAA